MRTDVLLEMAEKWERRAGGLEEGPALTVGVDEARSVGRAEGLKKAAQDLRALAELLG